jgi:mercuric ion transport protein
MIIKKENVFVGGAVFAAIASSLCCVLPLIGVVFGLGAFGAASAFETLRPYLLILAFAALSFSFYRVYFRREESGEGQSCSTKPIGKINQIFFWSDLMAIIAFALAPYYTGYIAAAVTTHSINSTMPVAAETEAQANKTVIIEVEGMTCEGCAVHINETLKKLKGIVSAEANYPKKNVKVVYNPRQIKLEQIKKGIDEIGYKAK